MVICWARTSRGQDLVGPIQRLRPGTGFFGSGSRRSGKYGGNMVDRRMLGASAALHRTLFLAPAVSFSMQYC